MNAVIIVLMQCFLISFVKVA